MNKKVLVYVEIVYQGIIKDEDDINSIEIDWDSGDSPFMTKIEAEDGSFIWEP